MEISILGRQADVSPLHAIEDKDVFFDTQSVTPTNANNNSNIQNSRDEQEKSADMDDISDLVGGDQGIIQTSSLGGFLGGMASMSKVAEKEKQKQERES